MGADPVGPFGGPGTSQHGGPLFVTGAPRSGTTLASMFLNWHPECMIFYESHLLLDLLQGFKPNCGPAPTIHLPTTWKGEQVTAYHWGLHQVTAKLGLTLPDPELQLVRGCLRGLWDRCWTWKKVLGDKSPYYALTWETVKRVLPEAKFIALMRPEAECVESVLEQGWGYTREQAEAWVRAHFEGLTTIQDCIFVELEWLQRDPRQAVGAMLEWAGVDPQRMQLDGALAEMARGAVN